MNHGLPSTQELMVYEIWANTAVTSQMYRGIGKKEAVMMVILAAREFGIGPAQALNGGINIIDGKIELSARMMSGLIRRAKHSIQILISNDKICQLKGTRADNGDTANVSFTIEEAQQAGLIRDKSPWKKTPKDMLFARALSRLARQLFSDVIGIGYVQGEISELQDVQSNVQPDFYEEICDQQTDDIDSDCEKMTNLILNRLEHEEKHDFLEFISKVEAHYNWDRLKCLGELTKDIPATIEKFRSYKNSQGS